MNLLIYLAIILVCTAVWYITRIFELSSEMRGDKQYEVKPKDNKMNGLLMLLFMFSFFAFCIWQFMKYKDKLLPVAASKEGAELDWLLNFNFIIIITVFFITNAVLFYFAFKYAGSPERKATYYPENHRLELAWTVIPGCVLAVIIFLGLKTWNKITREPAEGEKFMVVELYAQQFQWTARYSGDDNMLGESNYKLLGGTNALGIDSLDKNSWDDFIVSDTIHIPVGQRVKFVFRSQDVIHSAYFPHFRQQMNCVPGMHTMLHFVPTITTDSMRMITHNPDFNYILLCNKICGASHYNMQKPIVVESEADFKKWYEKKKTAVIFPSKMKNMAEVKPQVAQH
ncbi:MAG TPA: cytochrome c oxidase subunit II [Bacteroidia bacterium]